MRVQHGKSAWRGLERIPTLMWNDYLLWYRRTLKVPVRNSTAFAGIQYQPDNACFRVDVADMTPDSPQPFAPRTRKPLNPMYARRVVLARGTLQRLFLCVRALNVAVCARVLFIACSFTNRLCVCVPRRPFDVVVDAANAT